MTRKHRDKALDCFDWHGEITGPRREKWLRDGATIEDAEEVFTDGTTGTCMWFVAVALAELEAEALASKPMLYEAHGTYVLGPPGDAKGTGCLLCDMIQTIGEHDEACVTEHAWRRQ